MNAEQAKELRGFLIDELINNGYQTVVDEVNELIFEEWNGFEPSKFQVELTDRFIRYAINIFDRMSYHDFNNLLFRFNKSLSGGAIDGIVVEWESNDKETYNLSDLPKYDGITALLLQIRNEISLDNDNSSN